MDNIPERVSDIYQVFMDYFGESNTDLQKYDFENNIQIGYEDVKGNGSYVIIVHWDEIKVSNEFDESIFIWDLYCALLICHNGRLLSYPLFVRSTYDSVQWEEGYIHSHIPSLTKTKTGCRLFNGSCLGTGPLVGTISRLRESESAYADLDVWNLFCWELDKYVRVESLSGGPYKKIRDLGKNSDNRKECFKIRLNFPYPENRTCKKMTKALLDLILENNILKYKYVNGTYLIGMTYTEAVIAISNSFIEWHNSTPSIYHVYTVSSLLNNGFIEEAFVCNGLLIKGTSEEQSQIIYTGLELFKFKGEPVTLHSHESTIYDVGKIIIVNTNILDFIIYSILKYLNVHYGRQNSTDKTSRII